MSYELIFNNKSKKNSGHCFLRTIYPREDGSYLISFQFSKTNMVEIFISSIFIFLTDRYSMCSGLQLNQRYRRLPTFI